MSPSYTIRKGVEADLEGIWLYTFEQWGVEQADTYAQSLIARFSRLAENPQAGRPRDDVKPGYHSFPEGRHIVFYTIGENSIDIIGIPHQSMDVVDYLEW